MASQPRVETRQELLDEANLPEAIAGREQIEALMELLDEANLPEAIAGCERIEALMEMLDDKVNAPSDGLETAAGIAQFRQNA